MQLFIRAGANTYSINVHESDTVGNIREHLAPFVSGGLADHRLAFCGRTLDESARIAAAGIRDSSTLDLLGRLRGGASSEVTVNVKTIFGWGCCGNRCFWECCGTGRTYTVTVKTIDNVSAIFEACAAENAQFNEKGVSGTLIYNNRVLEPDRKVLFYDLKDKSDLTLHISPKYVFYSSFRKAPPKKDKKISGSVSGSGELDTETDV